MILTVDANAICGVIIGWTECGIVDDALPLHVTFTVDLGNSGIGIVVFGHGVHIAIAIHCNATNFVTTCVVVQFLLPYNIMTVTRSYLGQHASSRSSVACWVITTAHIQIAAPFVVGVDGIKCYGIECVPAHITKCLVCVARIVYIAGYEQRISAGVHKNGRCWDS